MSMHYDMHVISGEQLTTIMDASVFTACKDVLEILKREYWGMAPESATLVKIPHYTLFVDDPIGFPDVEAMLGGNSISLPSFVKCMRKIGANGMRYAQTKEDRLKAESYIERFDELMLEKGTPSFQPLAVQSPQYKNCLKTVDQWKEEVTNAMGQSVQNLCWQRIETLFNPISEFDTYCSKIEEPFDFGKAVSALVEDGCSAVAFLEYLDLTLRNMQEFWGGIGGEWGPQHVKQAEDLHKFLAKAALENLPGEWAEVERGKWSKRVRNAPPSAREVRVSNLGLLGLKSFLTMLQISECFPFLSPSLGVLRSYKCML